MEKNNKVKLTVMYSLVQAAYWINFVAILGYVNYYLLDQGLSNSAIGIVIGIAGIVAAIIQPLVAGYADDPLSPSIKAISIFVILFVLANSAILLLLHGKNGTLSAILFGCCIAVLQFLMPYINSLGSEMMKQGYEMNWGVARGIGSGVYAALASVMGFIVAKTGSYIVPLSIVLGYAFLLVAVLIYPFKKGDATAKTADDSCTADGAASQADSSLSPIVFFKKYPRFAVLLVGTTFLYLAHILINTFLYQVVVAKGGGSEEMGILMSIAAFCEIPTYFIFAFLLKKKGSSFWLKVASIFIFLKELVTLLAPNVNILYPMQILQMLGWALLAIAPVYYVNKVIRPEDSIKGQAYMGMTYTLGSVLGSFVGGALLDLGGANVMVFAGVIFAIIGMVITFLFTDKTENG